MNFEEGPALLRCMLNYIVYSQLVYCLYRVPRRILNLGLYFAALSDFVEVSSLFAKHSPAFSMPWAITVLFTVC